MLVRVFALFLCGVLTTSAFARAGDTSAGITLAGTHGTHRESGGTVQAPLIPVPLLSASHGFDCLQLSAEALPPVGPIAVPNNGLGMQNVTIAYADATLRWWNRAHTFAAGIGDTLYNQRTVFALSPSMGAYVREVDHSRVAGTRYELVARRPLSARNAFEASVAMNPAMHGRFAYSQQYASGGLSGGFSSPPSWERAAQVDANARIVHRFGAYAISYGVRYLNYTAQFSDAFRSSFADANSLLMPYVGIERFWDAAGSAGVVSSAAEASCAPRIAATTIQAFVGTQAFTGAHDDFDGSVRNAVVVALPSLALRMRRKHFEVMLEDVPPVGPIRGALHHALPLRYDVKAGYGDAVVRYWLRGDRVGFGAGDSLYVEQVRYGDHQHTAVRAAGLRYEALAAVPLQAGRRILFDLAASPSMHQRTTGWLDGFSGIFQPVFGTGSLVDGSVQLEAPARSGHAWIYGVRYVNYAAGNHRRVDLVRDHTGVLSAFAAWGFPLNH